MTQTTQLVVVGENPIHCEDCEQRIVRTLRRLPGVESVEASAETQLVKVSFDSTSLNTEQIQEKLATAGFEARPEGGSP